MNCYYHTKEDAVASCTKCGKGLCKICSTTTPIMCADCLILENKALKKSFFLNLTVYILGAIIGGYLGALIFKNTEFWSIYVGIGILPALWTVFTTKTKIKTNSIGVIICMFLFELIIAFLLSFVMIPIMIFKIVKNLVILVKHSKLTKSVCQNVLQFNTK